MEKITGDNHDQSVGVDIARRAMEEPLRQIVANAGGELTSKCCLSGGIDDNYRGYDSRQTDIEICQRNA